MEQPMSHYESFSLLCQIATIISTVVLSASAIFVSFRQANISKRQANISDRQLALELFEKRNDFYRKTYQMFDNLLSSNTKDKILIFDRYMDDYYFTKSVLDINFIKFIDELSLNVNHVLAKLNHLENQLMNPDHKDLQELKAILSSAYPKLREYTPNISIIS